MKSLSIVIPVVNSQETIEEVVVRTVQVMNSEKLSYEVILVDDASSDDSWEKIEVLARENKNIIGLQLHQNSGQHSA